MTISKPISVILLAGGSGSRMNNITPKQFLDLGDKKVAQYSFDVFCSMNEIQEIVVVCDPSFRHLFHCANKQIKFALPGHRRQDSVYNGLIAVSQKNALVCVHDSARPFIDENIIRRVIHAAVKHGAATAAMPVKYTVKECDENCLVTKTPDRNKIWEIQTPQVLDYEVLLLGLSKCYSENITVTDDVSVAELLSHKVNLVEGSYNNLKITTPEDLVFSKYLLINRLK